MGFEKAFWEKVVESADRLIVVLDTRGSKCLLIRWRQIPEIPVI
jgi:hypothetical protein